MHPFFNQIKKSQELTAACREDITELPLPYNPGKAIKAILLGADPTNDGNSGDRGLKKLDYVFGINSTYETNFFGLMKTNLAAIGMNKKDCYIQNLCRNYFKSQTAENAYWFEAAAIWLPYLKEELSAFDNKTPVLATCGEVFTFLTNQKGPFTSVYQMKLNLPFYSNFLERPVLPLFRGRSYMFYKDKWADYRNYLKSFFN